MTAPRREDDELQLSAYCDGELDAASASELRRRMARSASLMVRYQRLVSLRKAVRCLPEFGMPSNLATRIQSQLDVEAPSNVTALPGRNLLRLKPAAVFASADAISSSAVALMKKFGQPNNVAAEIVAAHMRRLLTSQPFDMASSDRHAVEPWFAEHFVASPEIPDLAERGFTLLGGRADVIGPDPAATIVYQYGAHIVSLTALGPGQAIAEQTIAGYNVRSWRDAEFTYVAVSDLPGEELAMFERAFFAERTRP